MKKLATFAFSILVLTACSSGTSGEAAVTSGSDDVPSVNAELSDLQLNQALAQCLSAQGWTVGAEPADSAFGTAVADLIRSSQDAAVAVSDCQAQVSSGTQAAPDVPDAVMAEAVNRNKQTFLSCMEDAGFHPEEDTSSEITGYGFAFTYAPGETDDPEWSPAVGRCGTLGGEAQDSYIQDYADNQGN